MKDEENHLYLMRLARYMAYFPLWAAQRRAEDGEGGGSDNGHNPESTDRYDKDSTAPAV